MADEERERGFAAGGSKEQLEKYLESLRGGGLANERYDSGRSIEATLSRHPNPETLLSTVRLMRLEQERRDTGGEIPNEYVVGRLAEILEDRKVATGRTFEELLAEDLAQELDAATRVNIDQMRTKGRIPPVMKNNTHFGRAMHVGGYGLGEISVEGQQEDSYELEEGTDEKGEKVLKKVQIRYRPTVDVVTYFGDKDQRTDFSERCEELRAEILIRNLILKNWGHYMGNRENLTGLVEIYFTPVPTTEAIDILFNLRGRTGAAKETAAGVELRHLGDKIDMAMNIYYINSICQKPDRFLEEMGNPYWQQYFFPSGSDPKPWIGDPQSWKFEDEAHRGEVRSRKTLAEENGAVFDPKDEDGENPLSYDPDRDKRGKFTRQNIFAESNPQVEEGLRVAIREFLGGGEKANDISKQEARTAQVIAYRLFKLWLWADEEGYEIYSDPDQEASLGIYKGKELQFENGPAGSDFGKLTAPTLYNLKSYRKEIRRDYGPEGSFGKYPRFCASLFRVLNATSPLKNREKRSFLEMWRGLPETRINGVLYPMEPAVRIGDLPWKELKGSLKTEQLTENDARVLGIPWNGIHEESLVISEYLSTFMAGRKEAGVFNIAVRTEWGGGDELMDPGFWLRFSKAIDVGINAGVATFGRFRGLNKREIGEIRKKHKQSIINAFWDGIASTVNFQRWESEYVDIGKGVTENEKTTKVRKIRMVAAKAGIKLPAQVATHKLPQP